MGKIKGDKQMTIEKIKINLIHGKYKEIEEYLMNQVDYNVKDLIMTIAYDTENLCVYCFVQYMINKTRKIDWIEIAIDLMLNPFCYIEGAYSIALYYARELMLINRNVENLERVLFFYNIPEKLVDDEEAKNIANEILKMDSNNKVALDVTALSSI